MQQFFVAVCILAATLVLVMFRSSYEHTFGDPKAEDFMGWMLDCPTTQLELISEGDMVVVVCHPR